MREQALLTLEAASRSARVVSTDVFDTLLLRSTCSQSQRAADAEKRFAKVLAARGWNVPADTLLEARLLAQRWAFRALDVGGRGEVRLIDVMTRQLRILGLPQTLAERRMQIELELERESLTANLPLAALLRACRSAGKRVVAVSDTMLSGQQLADLITAVHGPGLVDSVYASADFGASKRRGDLFSMLLANEKIAANELVHVGDDLLADVQMPAALGIRSIYLRPSATLRYLRMANGAGAQTRRQLGAARRSTQSRAPVPSRSSEFARDVFGPILAEFCMRLWLYAAQAEQAHKPVLLFCARGGVGIRFAFERVLATMELPLSTPRHNLMVSRLVAARAAVLAQSEAAVAELCREFKGCTVGDVAQALGGRVYEPSPGLRKVLVGRELLPFLHGSEGAAVLRDVAAQNALFTRHLLTLSRDSDRLILVDTGLYGSTLRLMAAGFPQLKLEAVQFARSNYKNFTEEHFPRVAGLMVEDSHYHPFQNATCVLRYWHLMESLFEPSVSSVRLFHDDSAGRVAANCGDIAYEKLAPEMYSPQLQAALEYIAEQTPGSGAAVLLAAEQAWQRLKLAITRPEDADLRVLAVGKRTVDFGRDESIDLTTHETTGSFSTQLKQVRDQHWRESAIAHGFPRLKHALWPALDTVHLFRRMVPQRYLPRILLRDR